MVVVADDVHWLAGADTRAAEARDAASAVRTMGVALTPCTVPAVGQPGFSLGESEVELGLGIHGEPGVRRVPVEPANALVDRLMSSILAEITGDHPSARSSSSRAMHRMRIPPLQPIGPAPVNG